MSDQDEKPATDESGSPLVGDLVGLGKVANSKLVQNVYADLNKAGATEQGAKLAADTIKALRLFTAPLQLLALGQDLLEKRLERVRNKVPEERQIEAHPQIAGPILQNLRFMVDGDILTEMYGITIAEPKHYNMYITHLRALNLIRSTSHVRFSHFDLDHLPITDDIDRIRDEIDRRLESIQDLFEENKEPRYVEVTEFGSLFIQACIPEDFDIADWGKVKDSAAEPSSEEGS